MLTPEQIGLISKKLDRWLSENVPYDINTIDAHSSIHEPYMSVPVWAIEKLLDSRRAALDEAIAAGEAQRLPYSEAQLTIKIHNSAINEYSNAVCAMEEKK